MVNFTFLTWYLGISSFFFFCLSINPWCLFGVFIIFDSALMFEPWEMQFFHIKYDTTVLYFTNTLTNITRIWLNDDKTLTFIYKILFFGLLPQRRPWTIKLYVSRQWTFTVPIFSFEFVFQSHAISNHRLFSVRFIGAYQTFARLQVQFTPRSEPENRDR